MSSRKKLTLSVDSDVIERAHRYSRAHGTSISHLVTTFLSRLDAEHQGQASPLVERIRGVLPPDASNEEHRRHLDEKHTG